MKQPIHVWGATIPKCPRRTARGIGHGRGVDRSPSSRHPPPPSCPHCTLPFLAGVVHPCRPSGIQRPRGLHQPPCHHGSHAQQGVCLMLLSGLPPCGRTGTSRKRRRSAAFPGIRLPPVELPLSTLPVQRFILSPLLGYPLLSPPLLSSPLPCHPRALRRRWCSRAAVTVPAAGLVPPRRVGLRSQLFMCTALTVLLSTCWSCHGAPRCTSWSCCFVSGPHCCGCSYRPPLCGSCGAGRVSRRRHCRTGGRPRRG